MEDACICSWFSKSYAPLWLYLPWKRGSERGGHPRLILAEEGSRSRWSPSLPQPGEEIHSRLRGGEKSPRQHISPGSPTLFISIIKSANTYHLSKICSNNKHSYRAYYGQWWDINLYPWKTGRKAEAAGALQGAKLAVDEAKAFSSLMRTNGKLHWFFFVCVFCCCCCFKIISVFIWSSYRNKCPGYFLSVPMSAGNICMRACVDFVQN